MRDNQPKHRQLARKRSRVERIIASRKENSTAWIVCEGKKTEPFYLQALMGYLHVNAVSVGLVQGRPQSDAVSVVRRAREWFEKEPRDRVFAVMDGEQHNLAQALDDCRSRPLQRANTRRGLPEIRIEPIVSTPCFELWLLLHFRFCDQPFACFADVLPELQVHLPDYAKADRHIFEKVGGAEGLDRALLHAPRLRERLNQSGAHAPATDMHLLVEALRGMAFTPHL